MITDGDGNTVTLLPFEAISNVDGFYTTYNRVGILPTKTGTITLSSSTRDMDTIGVVIVAYDGTRSKNSYSGNAEIAIPDGTVCVFIDNEPA